MSQRPGLLIVPGAGPNGHNVLYIGFAGTRGWLLAYDTTTLKRLADFNPTPGTTLGGIWGSGGGISADASGNLFVVTGDAVFNPGKNQYGDTLLKLSLTYNAQTASYQFNVPRAPWINKSTANVQVSHLLINYKDFRNALLAAQYGAGNEPLYTLNANIFEVFVSIWY